MISLVTLGDAVIDANGTRITPVATKKFALLLVLAAARGAIVPRRTIYEMLFGGLDEKKAQHSLRELAYQLRHLGVGVESDAHGLVLHPSLIDIDWLDVVSGQRLSPEQLQHIQGGFLSNYAPTLSEAFSEWLDAFRVRVSLDIAKACLREIEAAKIVGDWRTAESAARACLAVDPLNGHATIALAEVLAITGSATQAALVLDTFASELGVEARKFAVPIQKLRRKITEGFTRSYSRTTFPFVGREKEMELLSRVLDEAKASGPRAVLLFGDPGIGKSRIAREFAARADLEGCTVIDVTTHPYDRQRPMGAFIEITRTLLNQPGALGCSPDSMFWLHKLVGQQQGSREGQSSLHNDDTAHAITHAIVDLLGAVAAEAPVVLLVEDVQWTDNNSLHVLRDIVLDTQPTGVLAVLTARDERRVFELGEWGDHLISRRIVPLDEKATIELVSTELRATDPADRELAEWMAGIAHGNPFFADSLVAHYRTTGERFVVPPQLGAMVDRRIRAVSAGARDVLETIVALGRHATIERIERVLEAHGASLIRHTRELVDARLIVGERHVSAAHWLITESVQRSISSLPGRLLYRRIATVLESELRSDGDSTDLWDCAQLWVAAGASDHAADMIAKCAAHAQEIGRAREASDLYFRAAGMADSARVEGFGEASIRAAAAGSDGDAVLRAVPLLTSRTSQRVHDDIELATLRASLWADGNWIPTIGTLRECVMEAGASFQHRINAARALISLSEYGRLVLEVLKASDTVARLLADGEAIQDVSWLQCSAMFHSIFGDRAKARMLADKLVQRAEGARSDEATDLLKVAARVYHRLGEPADALRTWTNAHTAAQHAGLVGLSNTLKLTLASGYLDAGDRETGRAWLDRVSPPSADDAAAGSRFVNFVYLAVATEFALFDNDRRQLLALCQRAIDVAGSELGYQAARSRTTVSRLVDHLRGVPHDPVGLINSLTAEQVAGYESGVVGDFEMSVLIMILRDGGHASLAMDQLREYLVERRRPYGPLSANLLRAAASIGVADPERLRSRGDNIPADAPRGAGYSRRFS